MKPKFQTKILVRLGTPERVCETLEPLCIISFPGEVRERKEQINNAMRTVFEDLGCRAHASKAMVEDQGIDTLDDLCFFKDGDVEGLRGPNFCPNFTKISLDGSSF